MRIAIFLLLLAVACSETTRLQLVNPAHPRRAHGMRCFEQCDAAGHRADALYECVSRCPGFVTAPLPCDRSAEEASVICVSREAGVPAGKIVVAGLISVGALVTIAAVFLVVLAATGGPAGR